MTTIYNWKIQTDKRLIKHETKLERSVKFKLENDSWLIWKNFGGSLPADLTTRLSGFRARSLRPTEPERRFRSERSAAWCLLRKTGANPGTLGPGQALGRWRPVSVSGPDERPDPVWPTGEDRWSRSRRTTQGGPGRSIRSSLRFSWRKKFPNWNFSTFCHQNLGSDPLVSGVTIELFLEKPATHE